jgi:hypothetical protein
VTFNDTDPDSIARGGKRDEERQPVGKTGHAVSPGCEGQNFYLDLGLVQRNSPATGTSVAPVLSTTTGYDGSPGALWGLLSTGGAGEAESPRGTSRGSNSISLACARSANRPQVLSAKRYFLTISASTRPRSPSSSMGRAQ